ncbi:hypothetical protein J437_LFUL018372 [Ladona fulva]|uniref:Uncharacterized protein n=1 Tax=Ladona fulva TaxID=123851 RepID=A0A8K0KRG4_LADFU|nr:hypothetical protein J437_LFUL018372 [Ladona fulva]
MPLASSDLIKRSSDISASEINSDQRECYKCHDGHSLGNVYELSLAMLVMKRASEHDLEFKVATENENDGKFDDLSIEFQGKSRRKYFMQAKYKDKVQKKITFQNLESNSSIYCLATYLDSYCKIREDKLKEMEGTKNVSEKEELQKSWDDSRFIICTTLSLDEVDMKLHSITVNEVDDVNWFFNLSNVTLMKCYRIVAEDEKTCETLFPQLNEGTKNILDIRKFLGKLLFVVTLKGEPILEEMRKEIEKRWGSRPGKDIYHKFHNGVWEWMSHRNEKLTRLYFNSEINPYKAAVEYFTCSIWFGLNNPVHSFVGRKNELEMLHDHLQKRENEAVMIVQQQVIVSGLGGIGKSELARKFAHDYREFYGNNVIWINAEKGSILESFESLAEHLNIEMRNEHGDKKSIEQIVNEVYKWFMHKTCLFIFDNAEEFREITRYLPKVDPDRSKPYVLVTTRNRELFNEQEHGQICKLELSVLPEENALEFVKNTLKIRDEDQDEEIRELVNMLGCLPLALQHVVAYIRESKFEKKIGKFIQIYKDCRDEAKKLFDRKGLDCYSATIFVTYGITVEKIKQDPIALEILYLISFFAPDNIPKNIFLKLPQLCEFEENNELSKERSEMSLNHALHLLGKYSLIEVSAEGTMIGIHRLLQQVIRFSLEGEESKCLGKAITLMNNCDKWERNQTHVTLIWSYSSFHSKLVDDFYFRNSSISTYLHSSATPLHLLAENGNYKEVESLLKHISNYHGKKLSIVVGAQDKYNRTPLYMAAESDNLKIVKLLVQKGASWNTKSTMYYASRSTRLATGWTPLFIATLNDCYDIVKFLVNECKADVNMKDSLDRIPAVLAAHCGHVAIVKFLTQSFDPLEQNKYLLHAEIQYSAISGKTKQLWDFLNGLEECSRKNIFNSKLGEWTPLNLVASKGYLEITEILLKCGAVVERKGFTPLHSAASSGRLKVAKLLIENGANPNDVNEDGWTSLHGAAQNGHLKVVKYFIEDLNGDKHIDIDVEDFKKDTPLHTAAFHGNLHVVKYLIEKGAKINVGNKWGATPLIHSCFSFRKDIIFYLLHRKDVIIDTIDIDKNSLLSLVHFTPLHIAAVYGDMETVKFLVEKKNMDVDVGREEWCTPLHVATVFGNPEVIRFLLSQGADIDAVAEIKKLTEAFEVSKSVFEGLPWYEKFLKYFGWLYNITPFFFSWSSLLRSTPYASSKSLGYNEPLLEGGSEEQGFLANKILSSSFMKTKIKDFKYFMERFKEAEIGMHASLFHTIFNP